MIAQNTMHFLLEPCKGTVGCGTIHLRIKHPPRLLGHGCSGRTDGVWVDIIMVGTWMLWQNGWGLGGRYHGWDLDALAKRLGSGWTLSWLDMDALAERMGSGWTLSWLGHGCSDALAERMGSGWTLSWSGHGCCGRADGVWVDDIMVGTWMLWQNGWGLGARYHGWDMDAEMNGWSMGYVCVSVRVC